MQDFVRDDTIFMTLAGSHLYGTNTELSDIDKRGVCIPPKELVIPFANRFEQQQVPGEDTVIYGLGKFIHLATECNPNVIELLYAPDRFVLERKPIWDELVKNRHLFLTAMAYEKFTGYAHGQLKRIESHRGWLLAAPTHKPTREEFGLTETSSGIRELTKGINPAEFEAEVSAEVLSLVNKEKQYKAALMRWNQYEGWRRDRNPKRAALEAKSGYDTKHAGHLVRLLRMGYEILTTGELNVHRADAPELLSIRDGAWNYDCLLKYADELKLQLQAVYENKKYVVPESPNKDLINDLCVGLHEEYWASKE